MNDLDLCLEVVQGRVYHCCVNISKTTWARNFKFGTRLCMVMPSERTINFSSKWAWPRSRDPTVFSIRSNISSKLFDLVTSNLISGFDLPLLFDCRILHTSLLWGSTVGYPSDSLVSCVSTLSCDFPCMTCICHINKINFTYLLTYFFTYLFTVAEC